MNFEQQTNAYNWNSLPRFVFQDSNGLWRNFEAEIADYNITGSWYEAKIKAPFEPYGLIDPVIYYNDVNLNARVSLSLSTYDICLLYSLYNAALGYYLNNPNNSLFYFSAMFGSNEETINTLEQIKLRMNPVDKKEIYDNLQKEKLVFRKLYEKERAEKEKLSRVIPIPYSTFKPETVVQVYQAAEQVLNGSIYSIFNNTLVNEDCPLVVSSRYYKILKGYEYDLQTPENDNTLFLFTVKGKVEISLNKKERYEISFEVDTKSEERVSQFLELICKSLQITIEDLSLIKEKLNGIYYHQIPADLGGIPDSWTIVWPDMIMNEPILSKFLVIDEHLQANRVRKGFYMYLFHQNDERITLTIRVDPDDNLKVRVRLLNVPEAKMLTDIQDKIGLALALYYDQCREFAKIYNAYIPGLVSCPEKPKKIQNRYDYDEKLQECVVQPNGAYSSLEECSTDNIPIEQLTETIRDQDRQKKAPNVFPLKFSRTCENPPFVVSDREAQRLSETGVQVLRFPKEDDDLPSYNFVCLHKAKPGEKAPIYPGLIQNKLANKDIYPILPCCYPREQTNKKLYKDYYATDKTLQDFTEYKKEIGGVVQRVLISDKFVGYNQTGKCPPTINELFSLFTPNPVLRKGVHRSKASLLECILTRLNYDNFLDLDETSRLNRVEKELERLNGLAFREICAQELWDSTDFVIIDTEHFLDYKLFVRLLETEYKCKLVVLDRDDFIQPNFTQGYVRWSTNRYDPVVVVYQHYGSESDQAKYPQCELVELVDEKEQDSVYQDIYNIFLNSLETFPKNIINVKFLELLSNQFELSSQHIDFNGKVWAFNAVNKNNRKQISLLLNTRLPPINIERTNQIYTVNPSEMQSFTIEGINIKTIPFQQVSDLSVFNELEVQTDLMIANAKHILSETESPENEIKNIVQVGNPITYSKEFFNVSGIVYVDNEETKKRLEFKLELDLKRKPLELTQYKNARFIPFKFKSIKDFTQRENCIIAETESKIDWGTDIYSLLPVNNGLIYPYDFLALIQEKIYKCNPIDVEKFPDNNYELFFPQKTTIYKVGSKVDGQFLVIKSADNRIQFYNCKKIY